MSKADSNKQPQNRHYDVLVIGAGMVGAATAIGLARMGLSVLVLDAAPIKMPLSIADPEIQGYTPSFDERSTALSAGTVDVLAQLDIWPELLDRVCAIENIHVSEQGKLGITRMSAQEYGLEALGYVSSNKVLGSVLLSRIAAEKRIELITATELKALELGAEGVSFSLTGSPADEPDRFAKLMVVTDGANSKTARRVGIRYQSSDYQQHAIVTNVESQLCHQGCAYERFTESGPLALLPLSPKRSALVWTLPSENLEEVLSMDDSEFLKELEGVFGNRLGRFERCGKRVSYPLSLSISKEQVRSNMIVLGNAAQSLHPVAGQGFNLAIRGVAAFLERISKALVNEETIGSLNVLADVEQRHQSDRQQTIGLSDGLIKTFGSSHSMLGLSRELGLVGLNNVPFLKKRFVEQAMGQAQARFDLSFKV